MAASAQFHKGRPRSPAAEDIIAPDRAGPVRHFRPAFAPGGIIDAEYEEIAAGEEAAKAVRAGGAGSIGRFDGAAGRLTAFGRTLRLTTAASKKGGLPGFTAVTVVLSLASFWISGGQVAVRHLIGGGGEARGELAIAAVSTRLAMIDGMSVAIVDGTVRNDTGEQQAVPALAIRTAGAGVPVKVRAVDAMLNPGQTTGFRARLPLPDDGVPSVSIAFEDGAGS